MLLSQACTRETGSPVPYYRDARFTPVWDLPSREVAKIHTIAPFELVDQYGAAVNNATFAGKPYLVSFFFTSCPSICPRLMRTMKLVSDNFKATTGVLFLSHSVTPDIDSVARLYDYARTNNLLSNRWHFVTGDKEAIYRLARKSYFIEEEMGLSKPSGQFLHTENFVLIDKNGHIRGLYNGTLEAEVPRITEDIRALLAE